VFSCFIGKRTPIKRNITQALSHATAIRGQGMGKRLLVCVAVKAVYERSIESNWQKN
jgi:hypothetical protein